MKQINSLQNLQVRCNTKLMISGVKSLEVSKIIKYGSTKSMARKISSTICQRAVAQPLSLGKLDSKSGQLMS